MRGDNKGKEGKVTRVERQKGIIFIEKIVIKKSKGEEKQVPIKASNVMIIDFERTDRKRFEANKK